MEGLLAVADIATWLGVLTLVTAGAAKIRRPHAAAQFAHTVGLPSGLSIVRAAGLAELVIGCAIVVSTVALVPGALAAVFFASLLTWHWARTGTARVSCGCFGGAESMPIVPHLVGLGAFTLAAVVVLLASREPLAAVLRRASIAEALVLACLLGATLLFVGGVLAVRRSKPPSPSAPRPHVSASTFQLAKESAS